MSESVNPPYTNRGVENTSSISTRSLVDWLQATFLEDQNFETLTQILGLDHVHFRSLPRGNFGYPLGWHFGNIYIYAAGDFSQWHVQMTGQGCREFEEHSRISWQSLFGYLIYVHNCNVTRLDLAVDDFKGYFSIPQINRYVENTQVVSRFRYSRYMKEDHLSTGQVEGETRYFGHPSSILMVRMYDKKKQLERRGKKVEVDKWVRTELQLRDERAHFAGMYIANGFPVGKVISGVLANYLRFCKKSSDKNRSRWKPAKFWTDFLGETEKLKLSQVAPDRTLEDIKKWVVKQVAPSLSTLHESDPDSFQDLVYALLVDGSARMSEKHEKILSRYFENRKKDQSGKD